MPKLNTDMQKANDTNKIMLDQRLFMLFSGKFADTLFQDFITVLLHP